MKTFVGLGMNLDWTILPLLVLHLVNLTAICPLPVLSSRLSYLYFFLNGFCWVHPTVGCRISLFFVDDTFGFSSLYFNGPSIYPLPAI